MKLTESEKTYCDQKTVFFGVNPTPTDFENTRRWTEGIKTLVSVRDDTPSPSGRINGCYSWQRSPWD